MTTNNPENNSQPGAAPGTNPGASGPGYHDWRQQRWEWRMKMREERRSRPFHGLTGGLILILLGGLFLANTQGWISFGEWWQWLLVGLGVISIVSGVVRYHEPEYHHSRRHKFVWGAVLIATGIIFMAGVSQWWPLVLIGAGVAVLLGGVW
jgi:hypothetical protein